MVRTFSVVLVFWGVAGCILGVLPHDIRKPVIYHNQFAVHVPNGMDAANSIAQKYGFNNIGQIGDLDNYYLFEHHHVHKRSVDPAHHHHKSLHQDPQVVWVEQQVEKKRVKRVGTLLPTPYPTRQAAHHPTHPTPVRNTPHNQPADRISTNTKADKKSEYKLRVASNGRPKHSTHNQIPAGPAGRKVRQKPGTPELYKLAGHPSDELPVKPTTEEASEMPTDDPLQEYSWDPSVDPSGNSSEVRKPRQLFDLNPFFELNPLFSSPAVPVPRRTRRFPDPMYWQQWYLEEGASGGYDMNVLPAWLLGYTGKGVVISILDDGIQHNHPDLAQNYDPAASTDINDNDPDPMPRDNGNNRHGTRCAGEVAAVAFNNYCGVGVAYNASIGGVRMLDGTVNDAVEARAISLNPNHVDIYSASWGPEDDGKTVDGPGPLAKRAFINGAIRGRHGKGSIFVWASGNGGRHTDNCNCDGYTNSIFTLSISSASQRGFKPWYLEECSSTLTSTYSSGTPGLDRSVVTVDMDGRLRPEHSCTAEHTGTSASAPIAAGICALVLEANPDLTWRDMQHLVVRTSRSAPLYHESGWFTNGVGRKVSHKFGYGLMDAGEMVKLAERWTTVPPQHVCQTHINTARLTIPTDHGGGVTAEISTDGCAGTSGEVQYLEHVQAKVSLRFTPRGNINIKLISPSGTTSSLLMERPRDVLSEKFDEWPFLSVHFWGEKAAGTWRLIVTNSGSRIAHQPGVLVQWQLVLHGTKDHPEKLRPSASSTSFSHGGRPIFSTIPSINFGHVFHDQITSGSSNTVWRAPIQMLPSGSNKENNSLGNSFSDSYSDLEVNADVADRNRESSYFTSDVCHSECAGGCHAEGPNNCRRCKHYKVQGECVSNCPDTTYSDEEKSCQPCHDTCALCTGPQQTQCLSCHSSTLFVSHLGLCVQVCPLAYYPSNGTCARCGGQCAACAMTGSCTRCEHNLLLHAGACLAACPPGHYETPNNRCKPCAGACATCVGRGAQQCAACQPRMFLSRGKCVHRCPMGTYGSSDNSGSSDSSDSSDTTLAVAESVGGAGGECVQCRVGCSSCSSSSSEDEASCTSCNTGWRLEAGTCVAHKPDRCDPAEYQHAQTLRCERCHGSCSSCSGGQDTECLQCAAPRVLFVSTCLHSCPPGYFASATRCFPCPDACRSCLSRDRCSACAPRFLLHRHQCVPACPDGTYRDRATCVPCHGSCGTCWSGGSQQCATCLPTHFLLGSTCHASCPDGFYSEQDTCLPCYHNCNTCNGSGLGSCLSCRDYLTLDGGLCLECGSGKYFNLSVQSCQACHASCLTCSSQHACTSCQPPLSLHLPSASCRPCCPHLSADQGLCCRCDPATGQCYGSASADKRRIALSPQAETSQARDSAAAAAAAAAGHFLTSVTSVTLVIGLVNAVLFAALFYTLCNRSQRSGWCERRRNHYYRRLPVKLSSGGSSDTLTLSALDAEDEDTEEKEQLIFTRT